MIRILIALLLISLTVTAAACDTTTTETGVDAGAASDSSDEGAKPEPKLKHRLTCSYDLGEVGASGFENIRIIAGGELENTGNIGVVARVTFTWDMVGQADYKVRKTYRVKRGQTREVDYAEGVGQDFITAHQAGSQDCTARAKIVDTFGSAK